MCFADAYTFGLHALDELESTANTFLQLNQSIRIFVLDEDVSRNWRSIPKNEAAAGLPSQGCWELGQSLRNAPQFFNVR